MVGVETLLLVVEPFNPSSKLALLGTGDNILSGLTELVINPAELTTSDELVLVLEVFIFSDRGGVSEVQCHTPPANILPKHTGRVPGTRM